ncbi:MAG: hypothetical protein ACK5KT_13030 [Dysgonomonas sp.]
MWQGLIYGPDGIDRDIAYNLVRFYGRLGIRVRFSAVLDAADLLIMTRAADISIDLSSYDYSLIHIYDYLGREYDEFIKGVDWTKTYIYTTSEKRRERIIHELGFPNNQICTMLLPVEASIWMQKLKDIKYRSVHIGHFKPITESDSLKGLFYNALKVMQVDVWGNRWEGVLNSELYHGGAELNDVSFIYAQSEFAFGFMYPFQRDCTYSGRFWHAPLNGCAVFSEKGFYTDKIPGIIETDYTIEDIRKKISQYPKNRDQVRREAEKFWKAQNRIAMSFIKPTLKLLGKPKFDLIDYLRTIKLRIKSNWK